MAKRVVDRAADGNGRQTRALVAHHEAGHFLAGLVWGGNVDRGRLTIKPAPERGSLGHVTYVATLQPSAIAEGGGEYHHVVARQRIRCLLAGYAAESIFLGRIAAHPYRIDDGANGDATKARAFVEAMHGQCDSFTYWLYISNEYARVRRLLRREWARAQTVARVLLRHETVEGRRLQALVKRIGWIDVRIREGR